MKGMLTFCLLFSFTTFLNVLYAQRTISGTVTDIETAQGLPDVIITLAGTKIHTITDFNGKYSINIPKSGTQLKFFYPHTHIVIANIDSSDVIDATLFYNFEDSDTHCGAIERHFNTLNAQKPFIAKIQSQNFHQGIFADPLQLIQGKVAGLTIVPATGNPNELFQVRLRGMVSFTQKNTPLIVIDGIPNGDLSMLAQSDIASIEVLKEGAAAAIYGMQGSAGVLLVTTKSGKMGEPAVTYSGSTGISQLSRTLSMMTPAEYRALQGVQDAGASTDWLSTITRKNAPAQNHNLAMSGGTNSGNYRLAIDYKNIQGTQLKTGYEQYGATAFIQQKALNNKLTTTAQLQIASRNANYGFDEAFRYAMLYNPTLPSGKQQDAKYAQWGGYYQEQNFDNFNPQAIVELNSNIGRNNFLNANLRLDYEVFKGFTLGAVYADRSKNNTSTEYYSKYSYFRGSNRNGLAIQTNDASRQQYYEATANYTTRINSFGIKAVAGYNWQGRSISGSRIEAGNFLTDATGADAFAASLDVKNGWASISNYRQSDRLIAGFGRMSLDYKDTYFLQGSIRKEGSSRLGNNEKFAWFPSVSTGIVLSNLMTIPKVNYLKIRAGYGVTGGNPTQNYLAQQRIGAGQVFYYNGNYVPSYGTVGTNENPNLKAEKKSEFNIGIETSAFNNHLHATLDFYNRNMTDLLMSNDVAAPTNLTRQTWKNTGALHSAGMEAMIEYTPISNGNLSWTSGFGFSKYSATVKGLGNVDGGNVLYQGLVLASCGNSQYMRLKVGEQLGDFYGVAFKRVEGDKLIYFETSAPNGTTDDITRVTEASFRVLGNAIPKGDITWANTLKIGNFDVNIQMQSIYGHSKVNEYRTKYEVGENSSWNQIKTQYYVAGSRAVSAWSGRYVEDASFLKIGNISVGYTIPLAKGSLRFGLVATDPFYFTRYTGANPNPTFEDKGLTLSGSTYSYLYESQFVNPIMDQMAMGVDRANTYFLQRSYSLNVVAKF